MLDLNHRNVQILATAFHEAGHVLAALEAGCYVRRMGISFDRPGDGYTMRKRLETFNPIYPGSSSESVVSAWHLAMKNIQKEMKIFLAGPLAEAKYLGGEPLRLRGAEDDSHKCQSLVNSIHTLNAFYRDFYPIPLVQGHKVLNQVRNSTSRWINQPQTWNAILMLGVKAAQVGVLNDAEIRRYIAKASGNKSQMALDLS